MKPSAADPRFLRHTGPALVFRDYNDMAERIDGDDLEVTQDHVLVLQNAGPVGGPGMPEWGMLPIPKKILKGGRPRHAPHLRRAHERHQLRRLHPACRAGVLCRRPPGGGQDRRHNLGQCRAPFTRAGSARERDRPPSRRVGAARTQFSRAATTASTPITSGKATRLRFDFLEGTAATPEPEIH